MGAPSGPEADVFAPQPPTNPPPGAGRRLVRFLKEHPIICLALLTPGIPEYLSTSSSLLTAVNNPIFFFLQISINVGQYTAGALLIREAVIRWHKGWGTVFVLGLAYGITEEGLGDATLFNATHGTDGILGSFGRFAGVNWVWSTGVLAFHVIYSIGLPILLLGLAVPWTRGRSLLGNRGIAVALATVVATTSAEMVLVYGEDRFWLGWVLLVGCLVAIGLLVLLAYRAPADLWTPSRLHSTLRPWQVGTIGFTFFPIALLLEYDLISDRVPAYVVILLELLIFAAFLETMRRGIGRSQNELLLVNLAMGFVVWQATFGVLLTLGFPYTLPLVALAVVFFLRLRRAYRGSDASSVGDGPPHNSVLAGETARRALQRGET